MRIEINWIPYFLIFILFYILLIAGSFLILRVSRKIGSHKTIKRSISSSVLVALAISFMVFIFSLFSFISFFNKELSQEKENVTVFLNQEVRALDLNLVNNHRIVEYLSMDSSVKELLKDLQSTADLFSEGGANLEETVYDLFYAIKTAFNVSVCYLLDINGEVVVSTNQNDEVSFKGENFSFRSYFKGALEGLPVSSLEMGVLSQKRGAYYSFPVYQDLEIIGVVVAKQEIETLESLLATQRDVLLLSPDNKIYYSKTPAWLLRYFWRNSAASRETEQEMNMEETDGFNLTTVESKREDLSGAYSSSLLALERITEGFVKIEGSRYYLKTQVMDPSGWVLVLLNPLDTFFSDVIRVLETRLLYIFLPFLIFLVFILIRERDSLRKIILTDVDFGLLFDNVPEPICVIDDQAGTFLALNKKSENLFEADKATLYKTKFKTFLEDIDMKIKGFGKDSSEEFTYHLQSLRGAIKTCTVNSSRVVFKQRDCHLLFIKDVTDLVKGQEAIIKSEYRYRMLMETIPETVFELDKDYSLVYLNKYGLRQFLLEEESLPYSLFSLTKVAKEEVDQWLKKSSSSETEIIPWVEITFFRKDGSSFLGALFSIPVENQSQVFYRGIILDITSKKILEEIQLNQSRMESVGGLAAGIAHGFNNVLTVIQGSLSLLYQDSRNDEANAYLYSAIENALLRGKDIADQLLTFASGGDPIMIPYFPQDILKEVISNFKDLNVSISCHDGESVKILLDPGLLKQVFIHIIRNAIELMPEGLIVDLRCTLEESELGSKPHWFVIRVKDNAGGIPQEVLPRIFDPFFSNNQGKTGLGLAIVYSVIKKHNGDVRAFNEGDGAVFEIRLPCLENKEEKKKIEYVSGKFKVLLMDDNPVILKVASKMIEHLGYLVVCAQEGSEAIKLYKEAQTAGDFFKIVILDLTIPDGLGGMETAEILYSLNKDVKLIASSGYSDQSIMADYQKYHFSGILPKPYSLNDIKNILEHLI